MIYFITIQVDFIHNRFQTQQKVSLLTTHPVLNDSNTTIMIKKNRQWTLWIGRPPTQACLICCVVYYSHREHTLSQHFSRYHDHITLSLHLLGPHTNPSQAHLLNTASSTVEDWLYALCMTTTTTTTTPRKKRKSNYNKTKRNWKKEGPFIITQIGKSRDVCHYADKCS